MSQVLDPFRFLLIAVAGWMNGATEPAIMKQTGHRSLTRPRQDRPPFLIHQQPSLAKT
jgi:hypothetical protein